MMKWKGRDGWMMRGIIEEDNCQIGIGFEGMGDVTSF